MRNKLKNLFIFYLLLTASACPAQTLTADQIIKKVVAVLNPQTMHSKARMTIETSSGSKRTFVYESWSKNRGEKNLIRYLEPRRVKDQATLLLNHADDIWMYFPRTGRVRKLATHAKRNKIQGSDFSYEDVGSGDTYIDEFTAVLLGMEKIENADCFKIELIRKPASDISYARCILWVNCTTFLPRVIDYFDKNNSKYAKKRLIQSDFKQIDGLPTALKMEMTNLEDNTVTKMEILEVSFNLELDDKIFTERGLKR